MLYEESSSSWSTVVLHQVAHVCTDLGHQETSGLMKRLCGMMSSRTVSSSCLKRTQVSIVRLKSIEVFQEAGAAATTLTPFQAKLSLIETAESGAVNSGHQNGCMLGFDAVTLK